jgi:predicted sugar kinase
MTRGNPHRNTWRSQPGEKGRRCGACGFHAKTPRLQVEHADYYEPTATRRQQP